jgi:hypothetical protein
MKRFIKTLSIGALCATLLSGCPTIPTENPSAPEPAATVAIEQSRVAKEQELEQALDLYGKGQFPSAIAALRPLAESTELTLASRLKANKFIAFSHCLQGQSLICRQYFEEALKIDPSFLLADTESSHPLWGGEFRRAQRNVARNPATAGRPVDNK